MKWDREFTIGFDGVLNASINGLISKKMASTGFERVYDLVKILDEISGISGIPYPPVIILPEARVLEDREGVSAIIFANINYRVYGDRVNPVVETYLPLLLYGKNPVLKAIFAHELLHYIYLAIKYLREENLVSIDIYTSSLAGIVFIDEVYQIRPELVFSKSPSYVRILTNLDKIYSKYRLASQIKRNWIDRGKPTKKVSSKDMRRPLGAANMARMYFPDVVLERVREFMDQYVG